MSVRMILIRLFVLMSNQRSSLGRHVSAYPHGTGSGITLRVRTFGNGYQLHDDRAFGQLAQSQVRDTRTAVDLAWEIKELLDADYPDVKKVVLAWENFNTYVSASLYKAFEPAEDGAC